MSKIKITNLATKKETSLELDITAVLSVVRKKLSSFMKGDEVFFGKDRKPIAPELEKTTKLDAINSSGDPKMPGIQIGKSAKAEGEKKLEPEAVKRDEAKKKETPEPEAEEESKSEEEEIPEPKGEEEGEPEPEETPESGEEGESEGQLLPNEEPFKGDSLTPIELPEYDWAEDRVGLSDGLTKDGEAVTGDRISQMKVGQVRRLLKANQIDLNKGGYGIAAGFVDNDGDLVRAAYDAVHFTEVGIKPAEADRITSYSFQYDEHVARLHRTTTSEGDANVGIPGVFRVQSCYRTARATRSDKRIVAEHKSSSHIIPKARVVFKDDKITLSEEFVNKIKDAVAGNTVRIRAEKLLGVLGRYGQFFASDMLLGGRLNYWSDKKLEDSYDASAEENAFRVAVAARATADGVPVEGDARWGLGLTDQQKNTVIRQASSLHLKIVGGNEALVSPEKWIPTVAKYLNWKVVGFNRESLVPTIEYLQDTELRAKCIKTLKTYFASHLQLLTTELVGPTHANPFGYDAGDVKRIVKIEVNHGINLDGLCVTYELANGQHREMPWVGYRRGEHNSTVGPLAFDEEITSIEVGWSTLLRRLAFRTSKGRRFPESPSEFYGRGHGGEVLTYMTIEAPRACGIVGHSGVIIDSIGLRYRELSVGSAGPKSRQFLLDIEPLLFPLNLPSMIEMTLRGVLLAGGWRTEDELNVTSTEDKRNTLIVELGGHSNHDGLYLQGLSNEVLVGKAAIVVFLKTTGLRDRHWLKSHSFLDHRNDLIERINSFTDEPLAALQALSDQELMRWGSTIKSSTAAAIEDSRKSLAAAD